MAHLYILLSLNLRSFSSLFLQKMAGNMFIAIVFVSNHYHEWKQTRPAEILINNTIITKISCIVLFPIITDHFHELQQSIPSEILLDNTIIATIPIY